MKIFARKIGVTQYFDDKNNMKVATVLELLKTVVGKVEEKDKHYIAHFIFSDGKSSTKKPIQGQYKDIENIKKVATETSSEPPSLQEKQEIGIDQFEEGEKVSVKSKTKGKGFAGTVKRHGFNTGPKTHGSRNYRRPGSIGDTGPQRVVKGKKMAGHLGNENITVNKVPIVKIEKDLNRIWLNGHISGPKKSIIEIIK